MTDSHLNLSTQNVINGSIVRKSPATDMEDKGYTSYPLLSHLVKIHYYIYPRTSVKDDTLFINRHCDRNWCHPH